MSLREPAAVLSAVAVVALALAACGGGGGDGVSEGDPDRGAALFQSNCASCHGPDLQGTETGPPLIHDYYVPNHHSDASFYLAVQRGVTPHHWDFGSMPPVPALDEGETADIVAFVRQEQREAGLIE